MTRVEFGIWWDMEQKKPFAIWATDRKIFHYDGVEGWEEVWSKWDDNFENFESKKIDWSEFWDYWGSQYFWFYQLLGPFAIETEIELVPWCSEQMKDLPALIELIERKKIKPMY
ncbi:MAG: hypothetical protein JW882_05850 [Deltaproteobacteria bacterium]|nr:hypothetical protein [Deltaproteobacteria bacterium]